MKSFKTVQPQNRNFTAATLMYEYAKENNIKQWYEYGNSILCICGQKYKYHHWEISDNGDETETVTVFLEVA